MFIALHEIYYRHGFGSEPAKEKEVEVFIRAESIVRIEKLKSGAGVVFGNGNEPIQVRENADEILALIEDVATRPRPATAPVRAPTRQPS